MGHMQLGRILTYAWLGLVMYLVSTTHGSYERPILEVTLPYDGSEALTLKFTFYSPEKFRWLVDCLCDVSKSTCTFDVRATTKLQDKISLPVTISSDLDDLSTWKLTVDEKYTTHLVHHLVLTRHNSTDSDLKCWKIEDRQTFTENPKCSSKPQRVYLGGSRWLEIDDEAETFTYNDDDDEDCGDDNLECTRDCLTTTVPPPADSTESVDNTGNTDKNFVAGNTDSTEGNQRSSSDQKPVIVGLWVAVAVLVFIVLAILAVILWRRKRTEANDDVLSLEC